MINDSISSYHIDFVVAVRYWFGQFCNRLAVRRKGFIGKLAKIKASKVKLHGNEMIFAEIVPTFLVPPFRQDPSFGRFRQLFFTTFSVGGTTR